MGLTRCYKTEVFLHLYYIMSSKAIEFGEKKRKIRAITPFKVIQGHRGQYQWKARTGLVNNGNSHPVS